MLNHTGTLPIETERLFLRKFTYDDIPYMLKNWIANPKVQSEYGEPEYKTTTQVKDLFGKWIPRYEDNEFYRWAIIHKEKSENIGQIAFCRVYSDIQTAEIEYCIGVDYWGKGYAMEALNAVIEFSFKEPKFFKLEAYHRAANTQSGRVLEKSKMKKVKTVTRFELQNTKHDENEICYAITREEYSL